MDALLFDVHRDREEPPSSPGMEDDISIKDLFGMTCLHMACGRGHPDVVRNLLRHLGMCILSIYHYLFILLKLLTSSCFSIPS